MRWKESQRELDYASVCLLSCYEMGQREKGLETSKHFTGFRNLTDHLRTVMRISEPGIARFLAPNVALIYQPPLLEHNRTIFFLSHKTKVAAII